MSTPVSTPTSAPVSTPEVSAKDTTNVTSTPTGGSATPTSSATKVPEGESIVKKAMEGITGEKKPDASAHKEGVEDKKPTESEIQKEVRKMKLKINGQEREYTEDEVIRRAQMFEGADEKFRIANERTKQMENFFEKLKANPAAVLSHPELGINLRQFAEDFLTQEIKNEMLSPEERELTELRKFKQEYEENNKKLQEETKTKQQQAQMEEMQNRQREHFDKQISDILNKSNLPKTPQTVKRVAELLHGALSKGYELDVQMAVDMVRDDYINGIQSLFGQLDGDNLINMLGGDLAKKIRQHDLAKIKAKLNSQSQQPAEMVEVTKQQERTPRQNRNDNKFLTQAEWTALMRKKAGI